jgi:DNA-binding LacI/PurR family transcriptional regulator
LFVHRPTIKDVAKIAGVTYPTVSRVLSGKPYVADGTRERVMQAIENLGYKPSAAARSMITKRTYTIAMLVPHLSDANFGALFAGAEREARQHGYSVLVTDYDAALEPHGLLSQHRVDAALFVEPERAATLEPHALDIPSVVLDDVPVDNVGGARALARHLYDLGHRRVVFIGGPPDDAHAKARLEGIQSVYPDAQWLPADWSAKGIYELVAKVWPLEVTGVLAANDFAALGVIRALQDQGFNVPSDISVTGFDDISIARFFSPALTTVHQPLEHQGARATALLLARLHGLENAALTQPEPLEIVIRDSTGPPRQ